MHAFTLPLQPLRLLSYRRLVYLATVLTGFSALCAQVVWQRYLSVLVGSEARSITLVVAVFLLGLASGYYAFGRLTASRWSRLALLKLYGYTELLTGLYIFFFYLYFELLKTLSLQGPNHLPFDLLVSCLALLPPTFLMGASIPLLTATLPENSREISFIHSRIYGWNTLGAFFGTLVSGFYLLPAFGLKLSLMMAGIVNVLAALVFIGNRLNGAIHRQQSPPLLPSAAPNWVYLGFAFFAGGVIVSFEILLVRVLNLSIGAGIYNFPMILSIFIGALAVGSLSLKGRAFSVNCLMRQVFITLVLLGLIYLSIPYWPIWLRNIRVSLTTLPSNYYVYKFLVYLFLLLLLAPAVFFMGRLLPLVYALLRKNKANYGAVCGQLYFFNTLGTVLGTVLIGYLAFYWLNLDQSFKINLLILLVLCLAISLFEKNRVAIALSALIGLALVILPEWNRTAHQVGQFRAPKSVAAYWQQVFYLPEMPYPVLFFEDGPNTTVTVLDIMNVNQQDSDRIRKLLPAFTHNYSLLVNGKSDGDLVFDFSTMLLLASLPYLHAPAESALSAAVVGLGTGVTAGVLGRLHDVEQVVVLEISPKVVEGVRGVDTANFAPLSNSKVQLVEGDAFKYFTKGDNIFDLIVSEPSNPWVTGVENLYSSEFYQLASRSLSRRGILCQWLQSYEIDAGTMRMVLSTMRRAFPYVEAYIIGHSDLALLASHQPLQISPKRFASPFLQPLHRAIGLRSVQNLRLMQVYDWERLARANTFGNYRVHTLINPRLTYNADKAFFMQQSTDPRTIYPTYLMASPATEQQGMQILDAYLNSLNTDSDLDPWVDADVSNANQITTADSGQNAIRMSDRTPKNLVEVEAVIDKIKKRCMPHSGFSFFCNQMVSIITEKVAYDDLNRDIYQRFLAYHALRIRGLLTYQAALMRELQAGILADELDELRFIAYYVDHLLSSEHSVQARQDLALFQQRGLLQDEDYNRLQARIQAVAAQP